MVVQDRYKNYLADQRQFFDEKIVEDWERYRSTEWDAVRRYEVSWLLGRLRPARILDVGCGCGFHDVEMASRPFVSQVHGIDYSARSIEQAELHYGARKVRRWAEDLGEFSPPEPYDLVVSFQVIEHPPDAEEFLEDCSRCCRAGGHVAAFTVNRLRPYNRKRLRYGKEPEMEDPMHFREFTAEELRLLGDSVGLEAPAVIHYQADLPKWPVWWRLRIGRLFPPTATRLGAIWRKPGGGSGEGN